MWTYNTDLQTNRDRVRLLIGDVDESDQLLQDEELCFLEGEFGPDIYSTALAAIDVALVELARRADSKSVGPLSVSYASRVQNLERARERIERLAMSKSGVPIPYAGGLSISDKLIDESNTDLVAPSFAKGGFDNPGAGDERDLTTVRDRTRGRS